MRGIEVSERVPLVIPPNPSNSGYLRTKAARMGHLLGETAQNEQAEPDM
jgi:GTP cyclohydrolase II